MVEWDKGSVPLSSPVIPVTYNDAREAKTVPRVRRKLCDSNIYHIMLRGTNQQQIFHDRHDLEFFMGILIKCRELSGYSLLSYCLMSNHVHLLIRFDGEPMSAVMKRVAVRYAMYYNQRYERCGPLFQDRYKSQPIRTDGALFHVTRYIHLNPPKAGMCASAEDYPFSSAMAYVREALEPRVSALDESPLVRTDIMRGLLGDAPGKPTEIVSEALAYLSGSSRRGGAKGSVPLSASGSQPEDLTFMDLIPRITSAEVWKAVKERFGCETPGQVQKLPSESRLLCLRTLREIGLSIRKIARLTGIGKGRVEKALRSSAPTSPNVSFDLTFFSEDVKPLAEALPDDVRDILSRLESAGHEAYAVGGCVRDVLRGVTPNDWDICTDATPEQTQACFPGERMLTVGVRHGTVGLLRGRSIYEITTFRTDGSYSDYRHPDSVTFVTSLEADLSRRDFTVNAMAYSPAHGLADPFHGRADIAERLIRCVGDPDARFEEDALRVLRAMRFAATLGYSIEPRTEAAMRSAAERLRMVVGERVRVELCKTLLGDGAEVARVLRDNTLALKVILPELCKHMADADGWAHTLQGVAHAPADIRVRLSVLLRTVPAQGGDALRNALRRLTFDNATTEIVCTLAPLADEPLQPDVVSVKRTLNDIGFDAFTLLTAIQRALATQPGDTLDAVEAIRARVRDENACYRLRDLAVSGNDVMAAGVPAGRAVGGVLNALLDAVICGRLPNERDALLRAIASMRG